MRTAAARTLAWALWLGGWLVLGELGQHGGARWAGGMLPLAGWLALIGLALRASAGWRLPRAALAAALLAAAALAAAGLWWTNQALAAAGWAVLVVGASRAVRSVRLAGGMPGTPAFVSKHASPIVPALAGGLLAWTLAGDLPALREHIGGVAGSLFAAAALLALLLPRTTPPGGGCRAGLFDCALPVAALKRWREPAEWPLPAATLAMLPMMASLPTLADSCGTLGWPPRLATGLHLAAMLLPGALCAGLLKRATTRRRLQAVGLLLLTGGAVMWASPGTAGLMGGVLLHGVAWSLAWAGALAGPRTLAPTTCSHAASRTPLLAAALGMALAIVMLGLAIEQSGPAALLTTHALLAVLGAAGLAAAAWHGQPGRQVA
jgi:hypothetical protein